MSAKPWLCMWVVTWAVGCGGSSTSTSTPPALPPTTSAASATSASSAREDAVERAAPGGEATSTRVLGLDGGTVAVILDATVPRGMAWAFVPEAGVAAGIRLREGTWTCRPAPFQVAFSTPDCSGEGAVEVSTARAYAADCFELPRENGQPYLFRLPTTAVPLEIRVGSIREEGGACRRMEGKASAVRLVRLALPTLARPVALETR